MMVITNGSALITTCTIFEYFHFHKQYLKYLWQNLNYFTRVISIFKQCYNPITCFKFFGILWSCCTWAWVESLGFPVALSGQSESLIGHNCYWNSSIVTRAFNDQTGESISSFRFIIFPLIVRITGMIP